MVRVDLARVLCVIGAVCGEMAVARQPDPATPVPPSPSSVSDAQAPPRESHDPVLAMAPADAWFVAYTAGIDATAKSPLFATVSSAMTGLPALWTALDNTLDGPALLAIGGVPANRTSWHVTVAARTKLERGEIIQRLGGEIAAAWNQIPPAGMSGSWQVTDDGQYGYLTLAGPMPLLMTIAVRDGIVYGSTLPGAAKDWMTGRAEPSPFVETDKFARLTAGRSRSPGALIYVDLQSLIAMAAGPLNEMLPNLYDAVSLDVVESVALVTPPPDAPEPVRLALGVRDASIGVWDLLASEPSGANLARAFPSDTTLFVQGSMKRGSDVLEDVKRFAAAIDRRIAEEYEQERAEFTREVGLDPQGEFLANLTGAWAFAVTGDGDRLEPALLAIQLEDVGAFRRHWHTLRTAYQLEAQTATHRGITIERADRRYGPFSFAVVENLLVLSRESTAVAAAIDAVLDGTGLDRTAAYDAVRDRVGSSTSKFLYLNLAQLFPCSKETDGPAAVECTDAVTKAGKAVGLAVVPHERIIAFELVSSGGTAQGVMALLWKSLDASFKRARYLSARTVSTANVKGLLTACHVYVANHKGQWPESLAVLVREELLGDAAAATRLLADPYTGESQLVDRPYYRYRFIADPKAVADPSTEVVISEPAVHDGGAVFGFLDGHAEWIESPRADELLAVMRAGR